MKAQPVSRTEKRVSALILVVLAIIIAGVLIKQHHFNPAVNPLASSYGGDSTSADSGENLAAYVPDGYEVMTGAEQFDTETLSDKINGKAELYLTTGFIQMNAQRFVSTDNADLWFEAYLYDMIEPNNALSVYSVQRRPDAQPLDFAAHAYRTGNGVYFIHGSVYAELVGSDKDDGLVEAMKSWAKEYTKEIDVGEADAFDLLNVLPKQNQVPGSVSLQTKDVFGFDRLDQVVVAEYEIDGVRLYGFASARASAQEARELADAYAAFLKENTGEEVHVEGDFPGAVFMRTFGAYEMIFTKGPVMAGVHETMDTNALKKLGELLYQEIGQQ